MILYRTILIVICFWICAWSTNAQNMASRWFFGNKAGLIFTSTDVLPDSGAMNTVEGCASLSDLNGEILFYSNGLNVYDATHSIMPNGSGLLGDSSSTQSCIFVPRPGSTTNFFVFTVEKHNNTDSLHYSEIDMTLNGGLGDIVPGAKNIALAPDSSVEKLTAVQHANGIDYWVIAHAMGNNLFYAYLVNSTGVDINPILSSTGPIHEPGQGSIGYMKASPDGSTIALARNEENEVDILSFDNSTGAVNFLYTLSDVIVQPSLTAYGVEFSPNGRVLYVSDWELTTIRQYDLGAGNLADVEASKYVLDVDSSSFTALQLGPDGKIYIGQRNSGFVSRINHPDVPGPACTYEHEAVHLTSNTNCRAGLPNFIQSLLDPSIFFDAYCASDSIRFSTNVLASDSLKWNFGDPPSGTSNVSGLPNPAHLYSTAGEFRVQLYIFNGGLIDTIYRDILVFPSQELDLGPDTAICTGVSISIGLETTQYSTYLWNTGATTPFITISAQDTFVLTAFGMCDTVVDSLFVRLDAPAIVNVGNDTNACIGNSVTLSPTSLLPGEYSWSNGVDAPSITVTGNGQYMVTYTNGCGTSTDVVQVNFLTGPEIIFPSDTTICGNAPFDLSQNQSPDVSYIWNDFTTGASHIIDTSQTVWVVAQGDCGVATDTVSVVFIPFEFNFGPGDTTVCPKDSIVFSAYSPLASYLWNTGDTTSSLLALEEGDYSVTVTSGTCTMTRKTRVEQAEAVCEGIDCYIKFPNVITPNGDGINDRFILDSDCKFSEYSLRIYNRWGLLVHYSDMAFAGWDGFVQGEEVPQGIYYYLMEYKHQVVVDADRHSYSGSFSLFR